MHPSGHVLALLLMLVCGCRYGVCRSKPLWALRCRSRSTWSSRCWPCCRHRCATASCSEMQTLTNHDACHTPYFNMDLQHRTSTDAPTPGHVLQPGAVGVVAADVASGACRAAGSICWFRRRQHVDSLLRARWGGRRRRTGPGPPAWPWQVRAGCSNFQHVHTGTQHSS